jgi:hypothetical protein
MTTMPMRFLCMVSFTRTTAHTRVRITMSMTKNHFHGAQMMTALRVNF